MSRKADLQAPAPRLPPDQARRVLAELERVLASPLFRGSRRCHSLLRRITEHSVAGEIDSLKERALGVDVFGRPPDYDTSEDPVVRASAAEIRKKLAQFYEEAGRDSEIRIELPRGSYLAEFHPHEKQPPRVPITRKKPARRIVIATGAAACLLIVIAGLALRSGGSALDLLWGPVLKTPGLVLVGVGIQAAYNLRSASAQDEIQGIVQSPAHAPVRRPIREDDLILLQDRYVALDDVLCLVRITALLDSYRKPYRIRAERTLSFADLRDTPSVLIGAFDNRWTLRTNDQLRFTFRKNSEEDTGMVYDRQHPENAAWKLTNYWPNWDISSDYAIVTRVRDVNADRPILIAAGLTQYGTMGAGEFVSNEQYLAEAARQFPRDWQMKNLQIVLRVPVVNRIPGRPQILASYFW